MAKRALLVGINHYRIPGNDLRGCVNDIRDMKRTLKKYFGYAEADIRTLLDAEATTAAMRSGIQKLVKGVKRGDTLVFHYSGHGANVPDDDGDEADHRDEILCPTDLDWKDPLRDDWLRKTFDKLPAGAQLTVVMDCCHSGTNTRALFSPDEPSIPRYLPNPWDIMAEESGRRLRGKVRGELRRSTRAKRRKKDVVAADIPEVLIAGCRDTQTSADAYINGRYNGALTWGIVRVIERANGKLTNRQLQNRVRALLREEDYDQVPQLEGRKPVFDMPFLGTNS